MTDMFADVAPFQRDPLAFLIDRGGSATEPLEPLALGPDPVYLLTDPNYIKPLLMMSEEWVDKGPMMRQVQEVTGNNVVTLIGEDQQRRRAAWHSVVGRRAVEPLTPVLAAEVRAALTEVTNTRPFDARVFGARLAMRLLCIVAFGANVLSHEEHESLSESLGVILSDLRDKVFGGGLPETEVTRRLEQAKLNLHRLVRLVRERTQGSYTAHALDELQLSESDLTDEYLIFLIAGHDTTGSSTAWLCHMLATVPGLSDSIAAEAAAVRDGNGEIQLAKLASAKTTLATVQEVLRLYPPGYWFPRGTRQDVEFAGRKLTQGTSIIVSQWFFHRSERFWDAPNEFRLDRDYQASKAYIPFGNGPRICVGLSFAMLELQIVALEIASTFELVSAGPVGAPLPLMHLWPPSVPLEARARIPEQTTLSKYVAEAQG